MVRHSGADMPIAGRQLSGNSVKAGAYRGRQVPALWVARVWVARL